jgi:hypothetical protein
MCRRAVDDYRREHGITEPIEKIDWSGARWRKERETPALAEDAPGPRPEPSGTGSTRAAPAREEVPIPTDRELQLQDELAALNDRLRAVQAELEALRSSPLAGPSAWARRKAKRGR